MKANPEAVVSGVCHHGSVTAKRGDLKAAARFHATCRGRWYTRPGETPTVCVCPCHRPADVDLARELEDARKARQVAAGIDLDARPPQVPRTRCRNSHDMTPANTGPKGDCRECKRISSAKSKKRKKELANEGA